MQDANLQVYEKSCFIYPRSCGLPSFSKNASRLLLPKRFWKYASIISFMKYKQKVVLLAIYLIYYDSSSSTFLMLNMAFHVALSTVFVKETNWNSLFLAKQRMQEHPSFCSACVFWYVHFYENLIVLHHGDNSFLFYFDISIKLTLLTIISTMKNLLVNYFVNYIIKHLFYDKNNIKLFEREIQ